MDIDTFAQWIGYAVMVAAGLAFAAACVGLAMNCAWRKMQNLHGLDELITAHRQYKAGRRAAAAPPEGKE